MIDTLLISLAIINLAFLIVNTYWAYERTIYARDTLRGSQNYWYSWKKRAKDVASSVLREISDHDLVEELERRQSMAKKRQKRKR